MRKRSEHLAERGTGKEEFCFVVCVVVVYQKKVPVYITKLLG